MEGLAFSELDRRLYDPKPGDIMYMLPEGRTRVEAALSEDDSRVVTQSDMRGELKDYIRHLRSEVGSLRKANHVLWMVLAAVFGAVVVIAVIVFGR